MAACVQAVGRQENMVGWYHSHPGYGCWLSGIDVGTQSIQQQYQEPFLAIVVDPHRTIAAGKVEIGAFRTYPEVQPGGVPCLCRAGAFPGSAVRGASLPQPCGMHPSSILPSFQCSSQLKVTCIARTAQGPRVTSGDAGCLCPHCCHG